MKNIVITILLSTLSVFGVDLQKMRCPSQNFDDFLRVYTENVPIQKSFLHDPLEIIILYPDDPPELKQIVKKVNKKDLKFPLIMNIADQKKNGLLQTIEKVSNNQINLRLSKPDTGWQTNYFFRYKDACWKLEKIDDESM